MDAPNAKERLLGIVQREYSIERIRGKDVVALNSQAVLYLRSNTNRGSTKSYLGTFWFGITKSEYEKYLDRNLFIVCACVFQYDEVEYVVLPALVFESIRQHIPLQSGQWKFHLLKTRDGKYFLKVARKGLWDVSEFVDYLDFAPIAFRKSYIPALGEFIPQEVRRQSEPPAPRPSVTLEEELRLASQDTGNPRRFEVALERFFKELGFSAQRIGGPGETDILIDQPLRIIVDAKTTKGGSPGHINFTRIKRHMKERNAQHMLVVSTTFAPAIIRDAEMEGAGLLDIASAREILRIHNEYALSSLDYAKVFSQPGQVSLDELKENVSAQKQTLRRILALIDCMDFSARSVEQIKGRLDVYSRERNLPEMDTEEIVNLLRFLSHSVLRLATGTQGGYSLCFHPTLARKRLKAILRTLCTVPL